MKSMLIYSEGSAMPAAHESTMPLVYILAAENQVARCSTSSLKGGSHGHITVSDSGVKWQTVNAEKPSKVCAQIKTSSLRCWRQ